MLLGVRLAETFVHDPQSHGAFRGERHSPIEGSSKLFSALRVKSLESLLAEDWTYDSRFLMPDRTANQVKKARNVSIRVVVQAILGVLALFFDVQSWAQSGWR